jgi:mxaJ protein
MKAGGILILLSLPSLALHVCADPDYLPFSNRAGAGFENKAAAVVARALGEKLEYTWASYRGHGGFPQFLANTLDAGKCDVVMSLPYGSREELTTRPYYVSSYVFVFPRGRNWSIASMDSADLKRLRIGFERDTPVEDGLKIRGLVPGSAVPFAVAEDSAASPASMLAALASGKIDVLITWQPAIGAFLDDYPGLQVVPVPNERTQGSPERYSFPMSMAVRERDPALRARLDSVIEAHGEELASVLKESGVMLYLPRGAP